MLEKTPKVSVVMSCFNAGKYLRLAIDSILEQTYSDFEFIIWNDGSTDDTEDIVKSYTDSRIKYFYHTNTGLGEALRLSCKEARGEYIARMDADDIALPDRLSMEVDFLEANKDYVLVSSAINYINNQGEYLGRSFPYTWNSIIKSVIYSETFIVHPTVMFRASAYFSCEGYVNILASEDRVLWGRMQNYGKYANLSKPLLNYRLLPGSLSHNAIEGFYLMVLRSFRKKIASDTTINESDILFHNQLFITAKQQSQSRNCVNKNHFPEIGYKLNHVYNILVKYIAKDTLASCIIFCKNLYGYLKYHTFCR